MRAKPRWGGLSWLVVPLGGGLVGMIVQTVVYDQSKLDRPILLSTGLSTAEPLAWILSGLPLGGIPALFAMAVLGAALRVVAPMGAHDSRERMTVPFAGACALLAAGALAFATTIELPALMIVLVFAIAALVQVLVSDRGRMRWLDRVFAGEDTSFELVPLARYPNASDLPAAVATVFPSAAIVRIDETAAYRGSARTPFASTSSTLHEAVVPLLRRRLVLVALMATTALVTSGALAARAFAASIG
jgi:hypothetical protein